MKGKAKYIIAIGLLFFLAGYPKPAYGQAASNNRYKIEYRNDKRVDYYYEENLGQEEREGLLRAGGLLLVAGLVYLEPNSLTNFLFAFRKVLGGSRSENLFKLIDRIL